MVEEMKKRKIDEEVENGNNQVSEEKLKTLLEPLAKSQLVDLLSKLGSKNSSIAGEIMNLASADPVHRKLFVRGLAWNTTSDTLRAAFEVHGEIEEGAVINDKATGKSRGYGFITYRNMESAREALRASSKLIDGRLAVCNLACEGLSSTTNSSDQAHRKLFVGGLSPDITSEMLLSFFSRHGDIEEGSVAYDKDSNNSRGFGFVTYKTVEAAKKAIDDPERILGGRNITVKYADTKIRTTPTQFPPAAVPMAVPPLVTSGYPYPSKEQGPSGQLGARYAYPPTVPSYSPAVSYPTAPAVSVPVPGPAPVPAPAPAPAPYPLLSQSPYGPSPLTPNKDPSSMPPNVPFGIPNYPYYTPKQ